MIFYKLYLLSARLDISQMLCHSAFMRNIQNELKSPLLICKMGAALRWKWDSFTHKTLGGLCDCCYMPIAGHFQQVHRHF
jgi:hypothetical protein